MPPKVLAAISYQGTSVNSNTTSASVAAPTSIQNGDVMICFKIDRATSGTTAAPTGWTRVASAAGTGGRIEVFWGVYGKNSIGSGPWSFTGTTRTLARIVSYTGVDNTTPMDVTPSARRNASGSSGSTSITPVTNNNLILAAFGGVDAGVTWTNEAVATNPGALLEIADSAYSTYLGLAVASGTQAIAGATGVSSATISAAGNNTGAIVALRPAVAPTVSTQAVTSITQTNAIGNGNVTADGGGDITERGVCWNTTGTPTTANSRSTVAGATGEFIVNMSGLSPNNHYFARAYAINSVGTSYGAEVVFDTLGIEFVSIIDPDNAPGTDYSSLSAWENAVQCNLTATSTLVYSISTKTGSTADGATTTGQTSGALGRVIHLASSSKQILISVISGTFRNGEVISTGFGTSTLTATGTQAIAVAQCRSTGGTADVTAVEIDGWTTATSTYIKIWTDPNDPYGRHNGEWDDGKYNITVSNETALIILDRFIYISGLQLKVSSTNASNQMGLKIENDSGTEGEINIDSMIVVGNPSNTYNYHRGISLWNFGTGAGLKVSNSIFYGFRGGVYSCGILSGRNDGGSMKAFVYNNTVYNSDYGLYDYSTNTMVAINNITQNCTDGYSGTFGSFSDYNISDLAGDAPGTHSKNSTTVTLLDPANQDFRLASTDTAARDAGTSTVQTQNLASLPDMMYDIQGTLRGSAWDIGADEVPVDFVSTICENKTAGGNCANLDYQSLAQWEDKVEVDLTATSTRIFSGNIVGTLNEDDLVYIQTSSNSIASGYIVATTSNQIMIDGIISSTSLPIISVASGTIIRKDASNYWTVQGATTTDALGASPVAVAMIDGGWGTADTGEARIETWNTDIDNYIKIYTTSLARHNGKWSDTKYRLVNDGYFASLYFLVGNVVVEGLQVENDGDASGGAENGGIRFEPEFDTFDYVARNNIVRSQVDGPDGLEASGIVLSGGVYIGGIYSVYNNVVYGYYVNIVSVLNVGVSVISNIYNNTVSGAEIVGIGVDSGQVSDKIVFNIKNNISFDNGWLDFFEATYGSNVLNYEYNISQDGTALGANSQTGVVPGFVDSPTYDYHLLENDSIAKDQGVDLSSDTFYPFATDIDGNTRPFNGTWDIGADEYSLYTIYRSVAPDATLPLDDDNGHADTLSISASTGVATFEEAVADNIGVGDVIGYDADDDNTLDANDTIVFISGRSSSTAYTVQAESGSLPTINTSNNDTWVIIRAYTSLANAENGTINESISGVGLDFDTWSGGRDLVANNEQWNIACYANGNTSDTTAVDIDGWNTSDGNYLKIYTPVGADEVGVSQRHSGKWDEGKYRLVVSNEAAIGLGESYVRFDGLQIHISSTSDNSQQCIRGWNDLAGAHDVRISNNIFRGAGSSVDNYHTAFSGFGTGVGSISIWNNVIYDFISSGTKPGGLILDQVNSSTYVYNNTIHNCTSGIEVMIGSVIAKNNIIKGSGNTNSYIGTFAAGTDYNATDGTDNIGIGSNNKISQPFSFIDEANRDFHLAQSDTAARGAGTNLSADANSPFSTDIDGQLRNATGTGWDIGADEGTVEFTPTVMQSGGDYSTLSSWEAGVQTDLVATSTRVFSYSGLRYGTIADNATVTGTTSGATATVVHVSTSSNQILLENIVGTFVAGETVRVSANNYVILSDFGNPASAVAKIDGGWTVADNTLVVINNGWSTGGDNYIRIYTTAAARHNGKWDEGKYRLYYDSYGYMLTTNQPYTKIDGLQIERESNNQPMGIVVWTDADNSMISNNIIKSNLDNENGNAHGILTTYGNSGTKIYNNIIYGYRDTVDGRSSGVYIENNIIYFYNNTIYDCNGGIFGVYVMEVILKNNLVQNCDDGYDSQYGDAYSSLSSNNISPDSDMPGTDNITTTNVNFLDAANQDFRLSPDDTAARDAGTSTPLQTDSNTMYDIQGTLRDSAWDIGAYEVPSPLYRSVGNDTRNLNNISANISIASAISTATFSADMPANIGVGDAIVFGSPLSLAFISGRISSSSYSVQSPTGKSVLATTSASAAVYRAHPHLADWQAQATGNVNQSIDASLLSQVLVERNLVALNTAMFVATYASSSADTIGVIIDGWVTATSSYIKIYTPTTNDEVGISQRHTGVWSDEKYRLEYSSQSDGSVAIDSVIGFIKIEGLQIMSIRTGAPANNSGLQFEPSINGEVTINSNIIRNKNLGTNTGQGLWNSDAAGRAVYKIYNNIIYDYDLGSGININDNSLGNFYISNNTIYNNVIAIAENVGNVFAVNNAVFNNTDDFDGTFVALDHNASDDLNGTNAINISPSLNEANDWRVAFVDYEHGDFRIRDKGSVLYDSGTVIVGVVDDIVGTARPYYNAFDIGAFEYSSPTIKAYLAPGGTMKLEGSFRLE